MFWLLDKFHNYVLVSNKENVKIFRQVIFPVQFQCSLGPSSVKEEN